MSEDPEAGVVAHEVPVKDEEHRVSGRADTIVRNAEGLGAIELKTIDSRAFHYADLPYETSIFQDGTYLTFPTEYGLADWGLIAYIGKQDGDIREFTVTVTPEFREYIKSRYLKLEELFVTYKETGEMPPPLELPKTDYRIKYCEYLGTSLCCGDKEWRTKTAATSTSTTPSTEPQPLVLLPDA